MYYKTKNSALLLGLAIIIASFIQLSSCASTAEKKDTTNNSEAAKDLSKAKSDLTDAKKEYNEKYEAFKNESNNKIAENEEIITKLKADIKKMGKNAQADMDKSLNTLEQKNQQLKEKITDYKEEGNDKWESFKTEFNHDMDNLGKSLKDLTKDNV